jgi:hypothetical protein
LQATADLFRALPGTVIEASLAAYRLAFKTWLIKFNRFNSRQTFSLKITHSCHITVRSYHYPAQQGLGNA